MIKLFRTAILATCALGAFAATAAAAPNVVVSIKPIHSLVAALMRGVAEPGIVVDGSASPHTYQMKPSDASRLQGADIVFWMGHDLERFLEKPLESLGGKARIVELDETPGLLKLRTREGGTFEPHLDDDHHGTSHAGEADHAHVGESDHADVGESDHDHAGEAGHDHAAKQAAETDDDGHDHGEETDLHLWLNTGNAKILAGAMAKTLIEADPGNAQVYEKNLARLQTDLDTLAKEIATTLAPVKDKPFIVFHDAYQYFEKEFGVSVAGSITVSPETAPGAARIAEIHEKVRTLGGTCVFAEPQFEPKLIEVVLEGTNARSGVLDPEAGALPKGEALYGEMMMGIARSLRECLSAGG